MTNQNLPSKTFLGHPYGLSTLFFTEMWERFSYYGMRAMLLLFMVADPSKGGLGLEDKTGAAIYGLYTMFVYLMALPGGWVADRLLGLRKAVFWGGCLIALGHFCLVFEIPQVFFLGLAFIVIGTGLLKPSISSLVGQLYPVNEQSKRDAGFSIFYMGINLGAFIAPIITGMLRVKYGWHYGFAAAGISMILGLIQYKLAEKNLGNVGLEVNNTGQNSYKKAWLYMAIGAFIVLVAVLMSGVITINPVGIAQASTYILGGTVVLYLAYLLIFEKLLKIEKQKVLVIGILFVFSCMFWAGYEQQGSSLNLFAERYSNLSLFGWEMPAEALQSAPPIFVIIFSPVFAFLWVFLSKKKLNPSTPIKFGLGLLFMGISYIVMIGASNIVVGGVKASSLWLITTYLFHTFGEICLYPVGLSAVTKLAPQKFSSQLMGIFFMSLAFGNLIAGLFAGEFDEKTIAANPALLPDLFLIVVKVMLISSMIIFALSYLIRKLMHEVK
jgi:proton-dependent oligopeptide transporter, POT family